MSFVASTGNRIITPVLKVTTGSPVPDFSTGWTEGGSGTAGQFTVSGDNNEILEWTRHGDDTGNSITAYMNVMLDVLPEFVDGGGDTILICRVEYESVQDSGGEYTMGDHSFLFIGSLTSRFDKAEKDDILWGIIQSNPNPAQAYSLRVGMSVSGDNTTVYFKLKNVNVTMLEVFDGDNSTQLIDEFVLNTGVSTNAVNNIISTSVATSYSPTLSGTGSGVQGFIDAEVSPVATGAAESHKALAFAGDSWFAGRNNFVYKFTQTWPSYAYRVNAVGGKKIKDMRSLVSGLINEPGGEKPFAFVIGTGINDLAAGNDTAINLFSYIKQIRDTCVGNGVWLIVLYHPPVKGSGGPSWTTAVQTEIDAYNTLLSGVTIADDSMVGVDIYTPLEGDTTPDTLSLISNGDTFDYDDGSGNHILEAGYLVTRPLVITAFDALPAERPQSGLALTGPLTSSITSEITGNITG